MNRLIAGFFTGIVEGLGATGKFFDRLARTLLVALLDILEVIARGLRRFSRAVANYLIDLSIAVGRFVWGLVKVALFFIPTLILVGIGDGWVLIGLAWAIFLIIVGIANYRPQKHVESFVDEPNNAYLVSLLLSYVLWAFLLYSVWPGYFAILLAVGPALFQFKFTALIGDGKKKLARQRFGPAKGELVVKKHSVTTRRAGVNVIDFEVSATFTNPQIEAGKTWDYGFIFRDTDYDEDCRLNIGSSRQWVLTFVHKGATSAIFDRVGAGLLVESTLNISSGGSNTVKVWAKGKEGALMINGVLITRLNLSHKVLPGDISAATGFWKESKTEGTTILYKGFTVRPAGDPPF